MDVAVKAVKDLEKMGASEAESYVQNSTESIISVTGGTWSKRKKKDISIGLRTIMGKQKGFAAGTLPMCSLEEIEKASFTLCRNTAPDPSWKHLAYAKPGSAPEGIYDKKLAEMGEEEKMDLVQTMVDAAHTVGVSADCYMMFREDCIQLANSHGIDGCYNSTKMDITFSCRHRENETTLEWHSRGLPDGETMAVETAEKVLQTKEFSTLDTFTGEALFLPEPVSYIFANCIKWAVHAENYYSRRGLFKEKGEKVGSKRLSVTDDGLRPSGLQSAPFDGEGNPMQKTALIEKGVFLNVLHTEYTANKYGVTSTGNALRTATREPYLDATNFVFEPGGHVLDSLVEQVDKGVLIRDFSGDIDPSGGYFNGRCEGSYIEHGEIQYNVKNFHIRGNTFESLQNIEAVGRDQDCSFNGIYAVPLLISGIMVIA